MNMKTKFNGFFFLVALTGALSTIDSWIVQSHLHGGVNPTRALFELFLLLVVLLFLRRRRSPGYVLAVFYTIGNAAVYSYGLIKFFIFRNPQVQLPTSATITSGLLIISAISALVVFALDYLDYRKRRVPIGRMADVSERVQAREVSQK